MHLRRNKKGTKSDKLWSWGIESICSISGPFRVQEYIQQLIRYDASDIRQIVQLPQDVDQQLWIYEHIKQFVIEINLLVTQLEDICKCSKMTVTDQWMFLCACHQQPKECKAFQYMIHNLDHATLLLQNVKISNTRIQVNQDLVKQFSTILRRLYRIFSHIYYHHNDNFKDFEKQQKLCQRFTYFVIKFDLIQKQQLVIPQEQLNDY